MNDWVRYAADVAVPVFVVSGLAAAGLRLRAADLLVAVRPPWRLAAVIAANFVVAPALAIFFARAWSLQPDHAAALLLLGCAAGAPFLPKLAELSGGDVTYAVGLMLVLNIATIVLTPLVLPLVLPGLSADAWQIGKPLVVSIVAPLVIGMAIRAGLPAVARACEPYVAGLAAGSLLVAVVSLVVANYRDMLATLGSGFPAASVLLVALTFAAGYASAGGPPTVRITAAHAAGQRNVAAAMVIASEFPGPGVTLAVVTGTFAGLVPLIIAALLFRRANSPAQAPKPIGDLP